MTLPATKLPPFQRLLDEHGRSLWQFCRAILGPHDGDDLFQDTVLAALRAYPSLTHATNLRSWLFTIAYRRRIDLARAAARRPVASDGRAIAEEPASVDVAEGVVGELDGGLLWRAVGQLPEKQRLAVAYRYVADLPYADIAEVIDSTEAAARQSVRAGLAKLREEMQR
jgi:RNA polymerase sigma factor (sigma-70 family)